ncbi:MAG: exodeoxyribonuclease V subunit alpha, partial [Spirochaetes bacterium]|nr:exodeoxyribonuclease V subunit alpha [Spirochaetota bacterium]
MNTEITLNTLKNLKIIPEERKSLLDNIYKAAIKNLELPIVDYLTIRDLIQLSGYTDDVPLHAILLCMFMSLNEGSLCIKLTKDSIINRLFFLKDSDDDKNSESAIIELAEIIQNNLKNNIYSKLISDNSNEYVPLIKISDYLYFQKYFIHEKSIEEYIKQLLKIHKKTEEPLLLHIKNIINDVIYKNPVYNNKEHLILNNEQQIALCLSLLNNFVIISGGPGTGKTSIVICLLRCFMRLGIPVERIRIAAPTGRAAQKMTDSIQIGLNSIKNNNEYDEKLNNLTGSTIHRLLRFNPTNRTFIYNKNNHLAIDVLIIDEVSMVDVVLMSKLLEAIDTKKTKVIFLGDKDQLPSVEAGAVLSNLIPEEKKTVISDEVKKSVDKIFSEINWDKAIIDSKIHLADRIIILEESYRSEENILSIARQINNQNVNVKIPEIVKNDIDISKHGCFWVRINENVNDNISIESLHEILDTWMRSCFFEDTKEKLKIYEKLIQKIEIINFDQIDKPENILIFNEVFRYLKKAKTLTLVREGPFGCNSINRYLEAMLREKMSIKKSQNFVSGCPIIITRNDYNKELYNGDIGIIIRGKDDTDRAIFARSNNKYVTFSIDTLLHYELAFAITIHKSQGSEYDNIFLVLPSDKENPILTKEILYTGLTRAKKTAVIYGKEEVLKKAISK